MKKRWRSILTALLLLLPLTAMPVSADVGPKPSVVVALEGLEGRTCWGTLLSQQEGTGPYGRFYEEEAAEDPEEDRALRALLPLERMDSEGFHLLNFVKDCSDGEFSWTYYPPHTYKIALWFPEEDALAVSGVYHRYAFDSYYRLDLSGVELMPGGSWSWRRRASSGITHTGPLCWPWRVGWPSPWGRNCCWPWLLDCAPDRR